MNTHCPGCGVHKEAVAGAIIESGPNGDWKCARCVGRDATVRQTDDRMVPVRCPTCFSGASQPSCATCGGLGQVRVPLDSLNVYRPSAGAPRLLTEG